MTDEKIEEKVAEIASYAVTQLAALPGDVIVVRVPEGATVHEMADLRLGLRQWSDQEVFFHWLVLPPGADISASIHPLDQVEVQKAGAMSWPGRPDEPRCAHGFIDPDGVCDEPVTGPHLTKLFTPPNVVVNHEPPTT